MSLVIVTTGLELGTGLEWETGLGGPSGLTIVVSEADALTLDWGSSDLTWGSLTLTW